MAQKGVLISVINGERCCTCYAKLKVGAACSNCKKMKNAQLDVIEEEKKRDEKTSDQPNRVYQHKIHRQSLAVPTKNGVKVSGGLSSQMGATQRRMISG